MEQLGLRFDPVAAPAGTEMPWDGQEKPRDFARRLAEAKARAVRVRCPGAILVAADTIVVLDDTVLEKPADPADAGHMLSRLAGRTHVVHTAVVVAPPEGEAARGIESTEVRFRPLAAREIERYVATGEPLDKAGAYGIQGYGAALVESVRGCYFNVMGFPITRFLALLGEVGWRYEFPGRLVSIPPIPPAAAAATPEARG